MSKLPDLSPYHACGDDLKGITTLVSSENHLPKEQSPIDKNNPNLARQARANYYTTRSTTLIEMSILMRTTSSKAMKRSSILLFFTLTLAMQAFGQDEVNSNRQRFAGTWVFDAKKSDRRFKDIHTGQILEITYKEPELKIVNTETKKNQTKSATMILFTDNRGETNQPHPFGSLQVKSNTVWDKDRLIRTYTIKFYKAGTTQVIGGSTSKETWTTSEDGKTLTITEESHMKAATDSPYGELKTDSKGKIKLVYERKQ